MSRFHAETMHEIWKDKERKTKEKQRRQLSPDPESNGVSLHIAFPTMPATDAAGARHVPSGGWRPSS
jgi:hypothetical protein